jgi:hypothetical protein
LPPDLRAFYDNDQLYLVNISGRSLDISRLVFEQDHADGLRAFTANQWNQGSVDVSSMVDLGCYQVVNQAAFQLRPPVGDCPVMLGWRRVNTVDQYFWIGPPSGEFTVRLANRSEPFATCRISAGLCEFALPPR